MYGLCTEMFLKRMKRLCVLGRRMKRGWGWGAGEGVRDPLWVCFEGGRCMGVGRERAEVACGLLCCWVGNYLRSSTCLVVSCPSGPLTPLLLTWYPVWIPHTCVLITTFLNVICHYYTLFHQCYVWVSKSLVNGAANTNHISNKII